jgi:hypothetical protein
MATKHDLEVIGTRTSRFVLIGNSSEQIAVPVPYGLQVRRGMKTNSAGGSSVIVPELENAVLYPPYTGKDKLNDGSTVTLRLLSEYSQKYDVLRLLTDLHYRRNADGMILGCYRNDQLMGCAVMSRLTFGRPRKRLEYFQSKQPRISEKKVLATPIMWVRRFASKESGLGIGAILAKHVCNLAPNHFRPKPKLIEVITSRTLSDIERFGEVLKNDFLIRAGYELVGNGWPDNGKSEDRWNSILKKDEKVKVKYFYYVYPF